MSVVDKIMELARIHGLSQAELARAALVAPARISEWKGNKGGPSLDQAFRLSRVLGVSLDYLADDSIREPADAEPLNDAELVAVEMVRALKLDKPETIRRLAARASEMTLVEPLPEYAPPDRTRPTPPLRGRTRNGNGG